jgi:hypothetical protein
VHLCVVRLFVESILRYGLPPQFQAVVVKPLPKMETRLRLVLASAFGTGACGGARGAPGAGRLRQLAAAGGTRCFAVARVRRWRPMSPPAAGAAPPEAGADIGSPRARPSPPPLPAPPADSEYWREDLAAGGGIATSEIDAYPYVSLTVNTET